MPIGKDSIKTRVAKVVATEKAAQPPKAEAPVEVKPAAKKPAAPKAPKAEGKAPARKPATKKPAAPKAEAPAVETAVLANVSPETVAAVMGHEEKKPADKVKIGQKLPIHLL